MFGTTGRPAKSPSVDSVRDLTAADLRGLVRTKVYGKVKKFRDSHHMLARLFAMGLRPGEIAEEVGYSKVRVSTLQTDPAFQELIAHYQSLVDESFSEKADEYFETVSSNRRIAARLINDKLNDAEPDDVSFRELVMIHSDSADRTGYPKRQVAINVNTDFASLLDKAIQRSQQSDPKLIEHDPSGSLPAGADGVGQENQSSSSGPQLLRRRA